MGRTEIQQGDVTVAYGKDDITGYFLTVTDKRLQYSSDAGDKVNDIANKVEEHNGYGGYFDLHTGMHGFGFTVDLETLLEFWKRYDVPLEDILSARWGGEVPKEKREISTSGSKSNARESLDRDSEPCIVCGKITKLRCSKCKAIYACSKEHSKKGWKRHRVGCNKSNDTSKLESKHPVKLVKAYLLSETSTEPRLVDIECEIRPPEDGEGGFDTCYPAVKERFNSQSVECIPITITGDRWVWGCSGPVVNIFVRDAFLYDKACKPNQCVKAITAGKASHPWAGPILLVKQEDFQIERLIDADDKVLQAGISYFKNYPKAPS